MAGFADVKSRFARLLRGNVRPDDLFMIFLALRQMQPTLPVVRELGDAIAHGAERDRGVISQRVNDLATVLHHYSLAIESGERREGGPYSESLEYVVANYRITGAARISKDTGLSPKRVDDNYRKIRLRYTPNQHGQAVFDRSNMAGDERTVFEYLTHTFRASSAFSGEELFEDATKMLLAHDLLDKAEEPLLRELRSHIILFAIAAFHDVKYVLPDRSTAHSAAAWGANPGDPTLDVGITLPFYASGKRNELRVSLFRTDIPADLLDTYDETIATKVLDYPIELTAGPRLSRI